MVRLLLRLTLALMVVFTLAVGLIRAQPYDDRAARAFLSQSEACAPCFMGIRIGQMTTEQVMTWLDQHPWVNKLILTPRSGSIWGGTINWDWSGQQPGWIDAAHEGSIWTQGHVAQFVRFQTALTFGDLWLAFDQPPEGTLRVERSTAGGKRIVHYAAYSDQNFVAGFTLPCPLRPADFWHHPVQIQFYDGQGQFNDYDLRGWANRVSC